MPKIQVNGVELYYEEYGSGDEIVISAQMSFYQDSYQKRLSMSPANYHVFMITLRGYGESTHVFEDFGTNWYNIWADDICEFARLIGIKKFLYTGVSHGAGVGWAIARRNPEMLKGFISVVGAPHDRAGGDISEARRQTIESADDLENKPAKRLPFTVPTKDESRLLRRQKMIEERQNTTMTREERLINPRKPFPDCKTNEELAIALSNIEVPTLLLCAVQDDIISAEMSLLAAKSVPRAKAIFYQDHTHTLASESPDDLIQEVVVFVDGLKERVIVN